MLETPVSKNQNLCQAQMKHQAFSLPQLFRYSSLQNILFHMSLHQSRPLIQNYLSFLSVHPETMQALQLLVLAFALQV